MKGITEWLASIGLSEYAQRFADNGIDLSVIRDLTEQDLKDLGVLLGHRRRILRAIAELDGGAPSPTGTSVRAVCLARSRVGNGVSKVKEHGTIVTRVQRAKFLIIAV